ncbi:universal stress protein [Arthrobacter pigmenti]
MQQHESHQGAGTYIVFGATIHQPEMFLRTAAVYAARFNAELVCASVAASNYTIEEFPDGNIRSAPVDADLPDMSEAVFDPQLQKKIADILDVTEVRWSTRILAGDPAHSLAHLADRLSASMIIVGARDATVRAAVGEFLRGSVAAHLVHRQHRPVVVIPLNPVETDAALPWETR